jgi:class III poly(R)-hydroxyalkanoic acid synthase PhaE subunit
MTKETLFNDDWLKLQQRYWDGLSEMGRKAMGMDTAQRSNPWEAAMTQWWQALSPAASNPAQDFMQRLMQQGKTYFSTVEKMMQGFTGADPTQGWQALNQTFDQMQKAFTGGTGDLNDAMHRMMGFWEMPLDNWQRMMSSMTPMMPGDLLRNMPHDQVKGSVDRMLSAPGLGYSREEQAQYQDLIRRSMDYQRALQEYVGFFGMLGGKSVERMREFVRAQADSGKSIDSVRNLYDSWVSCCEAVYAEEVSTPEYARIHGQLANTQMALKKRMSIMVDETLGAMNMPTRSELRTLQDRLQETRRESKKLRHDLDRLTRRIASLPGADSAEQSRAPAKALASPQAASQTTAATTKKIAARKKTAAKTNN